MKTVYATIVIVAFFGGVAIVSGALDINKEINQLRTQIKGMKPPPELVGSMLQQIQAHCKKNRTIDQNLLNNASKCVEQYMNETQIFDNIEEAIPRGDMDKVFHSTCLKWPKVKGCLHEFFSIIEDCWEKGDKVTKMVDESVKFFCGDDNDGGRIALFVAEDGIQCLQQHGDGVKKCLEKMNDFETPEDPSEITIPDPDKLNVDEICGKMTEIYKCTSKEFKKCKNTTPQNLATSMIRYASGHVGCKIPDDEKLMAKSTSTSDAAILAGWSFFSFLAALLTL